jgi:hypothetical protein
VTGFQVTPQPALLILTKKIAAVTLAYRCSPLCLVESPLGTTWSHFTQSADKPANQSTECARFFVQTVQLDINLINQLSPDVL